MSAIMHTRHRAFSTSSIRPTPKKVATVSGLTKSEYVSTLIIGRELKGGILDIALIYYHSEIPIEDAKAYMENILKKI